MNCLTASPLDESIQLVLAVFQEGSTLSQHAANVVHLHSQHLVHVLLLDALLTDEFHHSPTFLKSLDLCQQGVLFD